MRSTPCSRTPTVRACKISLTTSSQGAIQLKTRGFRVRSMIWREQYLPGRTHRLGAMPPAPPLPRVSHHLCGQPRRLRPRRRGIGPGVRAHRAACAATAEGGGGGGERPAAYRRRERHLVVLGWRRTGVVVVVFSLELRGTSPCTLRNWKVQWSATEKIPLSFSEMSSGVVTRQKGI
jgi:hypothetical protein